MVSVSSRMSFGLVVRSPWLYYWFTHHFCVVLGKLSSPVWIQFPYLERERMRLPLNTRKILTDSCRVTAKKKKWEAEFHTYQLQNFPPETIIKPNKTVGQHSKQNRTIFQMNNNHSNANKKMAKIY